MRNVSVSRLGTLWQLWDGEIIYPHKMTCELRERLDMPADPKLHISFGIDGQIHYYDEKHKHQTATCHGFGGVTDDCILAPNGMWYHLGGTSLKFVDGVWYATWTGYRNDHLSLMLNAGFWAYRNYFPLRWYIQNIYRRTRYAVIERLHRLDWALRQRGWRDH